MKTDAKTQIEIFKLAISNLENGFPVFQGIEFKSVNGGKWIDEQYSYEQEDGPSLSFHFNEYRIKPKTIIVNGVEIPKPLDVSEISPGGHYYFMPCLSNQLCIAVDGYHGQKFEYKHLYKTEEEAIEASKKLFGIE